MNTAELTGKMAETARIMIESIAELQNISNTALRALAKQQLDAIEEFNAVGMRRLKELAATKTPTELWAVQTKTAAEVADELKSSTMRAMKVLEQCQKDLQAFLEKSVSVFDEKVRL
ncbi:MAG: phasin family protein [Magnetococcales bacterium]|nr:phasin family protein [Magnetococcales bacterium]